MSIEIDNILGDYGAPLEITVEIDSARRDTGALKTWYFSTEPRSTGASETPANTEFLPFLRSGGVLGPLSQSLSEDIMFSGLAQNNPGVLTLLQSVMDNDQLSEMNDYVFAGYQVRINIGRESDLYTEFERLRTSTVRIDPEIVLTSSGLQASFQLSGSLNRTLEEPLIVKRYVGIPHCIRIMSGAGSATATKVAAHDISVFTIMIRFRMMSIPAANRRVWTKFTNALSNAHWFTQLVSGSGKLNVRSSSGGVANIDYTSINNLCDGQFHSLVFSRNNQSIAYIMIDDAVEVTFTPTGPVDLSAANLVFGLSPTGGGDDIDICDARLIDRYMSAEDAIGYFSTRSNGDDLNVIGLWRFDDNTGGVANDYSSTNADATMAGVINVDYSWQPSDLGEPELAGQPYPIVFPSVLNARAHLIDANRERYRANNDTTGWYSAGSGYSLTVKSQGTVLTGGVDYTITSDGFSMTTQEAEPVTYDLIRTGPSIELNTYPSALAYYLITARTRLSSTDLSNVDPMYLLCPWPSGFQTDREMTLQQALAEVLGGSGMYYYEEPLGSLFLDILLPPVGYGPYGDPCVDLRSGYISYGDLADVTGSCTVAAWFKSNLQDQTLTEWGGSEPSIGSATIITKGDANYHLYFQSVGASAGKIKFRTAQSTLSSPAGLIEPSTWYFIAGVFDDLSNTQKIYIGKLGGTLVEVASQSNTNTQIVNSQGLWIGSNGRFTLGGVQHAQVWSTAKTLSQLQALMSTPPLGTEGDILAYIPLNEGIESPRELVSNTLGTMTVGTNSWQGPQWAPKFTIDLEDTPSIKLNDFHHIHPVYDTTVRYARNRYPMENADIDTGVSQNSRLDLTREWKEARARNPKIRTIFKHAKKIVIDSPIIDQESAQRLVRVISSRLTTDRYVGVLNFPPGLNASRLACGLILGDEVGVRSNIPSQLQTARSFRVVSIAPNPLQLSTLVALFS